MPTLPGLPFPVYTWGLGVGIGLIGALGWAERMARHWQVPGEDVWKAGLIAFGGGMLGARLLFVLENLATFWPRPLAIFKFWEGGFSAWGGIIGGIAVAWFWLRYRRKPWQPFAALAGPAALWADFWGRLGGAASHMYRGRPTTFWLAYIEEGVQRLEVGLMLALASLVGFCWLAFLLRKSIRKSKMPPLWLGKYALAWYAFSRLILDFGRADDTRYVGLTVAQYFSLAILLIIVMLSFVKREGLQKDKTLL
jgi:phosphatidylglycerol:prolipoprotein diacylglycerol transferase